MMKSPKHWQTISLILFLAASIFVCYFATNSTRANIWLERFMGGSVFYIDNIEIKTPKYCIVEHSKGSAERKIVSFRCATPQNEYTWVSISKSKYKYPTEIAEMKSDAEEFDEFNDYIYMTVGPKQGLKTLTFPVYYLKRQNVVIYSSSSQSKALAKEFADLLIKYDFWIESVVLDK